MKEKEPTPCPQLKAAAFVVMILTPPWLYIVAQETGTLKDTGAAAMLSAIFLVLAYGFRAILLEFYRSRENKSHLYYLDSTSRGKSLQQIKNLRDAGTITEETLICRDDLDHWQPLADYPELTT